ncbi:phosphoenolpyruvate synthase [Desulfovibrio sp. OttesenSCG-928-A18]|nr:phosphoenolpyruvate synthase [Desulfovibrio sp. OttesenSCG-928-A18]
MGIFDAVSALFRGERRSSEQGKQEEELRRAFKTRCSHFRSLLSANKRALATMATLEEAMQGQRLFSMSFVRANCTTLIAAVFNMVRHLDALSGGAYPELLDRLKDIQQKIDCIISPKNEPVSGPLVLPMEAIGIELAHEVGAKMASLGEARQSLGRTIPKGFVITASGFKRFIEANKLQEEINRRMQITDLAKLDAVFALSSSLQQLIITSPVPDDLERAIMEQYEAMADSGPEPRLAVRSSAIGEDAIGTSFAGQYRSELNVTRDSLLDTYKEVVASKYGVTAMTYRVNRGISDDEVPMCVGCLEMIPATAGGVAYSMDPMGREAGVVINSAPGLPGAVVDGSVDVDVFRVSREKPRRILHRHVPLKRFRLECSPDEGVLKRPLDDADASAPSLDDEQILQVAKCALEFEDLYDQPQDVEWAFAPDGGLVVLQSRPLSGMEEALEGACVPEGTVVLAEGGICASPGVGAGPVFVVRRDADMLRFPPGAVLVVEQAHARWAPILNRASALVAEFGGAAGHLASVAREFRAPALFGVENALRLLAAEQEVTVDADARRVLQGRVEEVLAHKREPRVSFAGSPVHAVLAKTVHHIVPLHLLHPESPTFSPAFCETLHDITRFCHEKAVEEMFRMDESLFCGRCGKQLKYKGGKLQYYVVDIENGFCEPVPGKYIEMEQICCPPMHALWEGMIAIPWAGPVGTTARGFLALVAESAGNPDLEVTRASDRMLRNYFLVDREYCNLQASFGYHFCTVEAQAGKADQENYVNFHFKGGAANIARRLMRVNAIADVLAENGFIVEVKEDALSARAEELSAREVLELLLILGYLIIHTRQMDAAMGGEDSRTAFADTLRKGIAQVLTMSVDRS